MSLNILPECYADTSMMNIIGFKRVNHCLSIGEVANRMEKSYKNRLAIGIVDRDKPGSIPPYFHGFETIKEFDGFQLKKLPNTKHYLIVIAPALERWIMDTALKLGIPIDKYGFTSLKKLLRVTKSQTVGSNKNFQALVNTLYQKKNSPLKQMKAELMNILG